MLIVDSRVAVTQKIIENFQTQFQFPVCAKREKKGVKLKVYLYDFRSSHGLQNSSRNKMKMTKGKR